MLACHPRFKLCISPLLLAVLYPSLLGTALGDGWRAILVPDRAAACTASLDALDHAHGRGVALRDLAEDDVALVQPGGDDGGDEELRAVGVRAGVGHGEHEWPADIYLF